MEYTKKHLLPPFFFLEKPYILNLYYFRCILNLRGLLREASLHHCYFLIFFQNIRIANSCGTFQALKLTFPEFMISGLYFFKILKYFYIHKKIVKNSYREVVISFLLSPAILSCIIILNYQKQVKYTNIKCLYTFMLSHFIKCACLCNCYPNQNTELFHHHIFVFLHFMVITFNLPSVIPKLWQSLICFPSL